LNNDGSAKLGNGGIEIKKDGSIQLGSNVTIG
jgi:hypothetical protein